MRPPPALGLLLLLRAATLSADGAQGLGAASLGQAGAVAAQPLGAEALFENPAGLRQVEGPQWNAAGALGGPTGEWVGALSLALPLTGTASWGLSAQHSGLQEGGSYRQDSVALAVAIPVVEDWLWAGIQPAIGASSGAGAGAWSLDAGLQMDLAQALGWQTAWDWGFVVHDLASDSGASAQDEALPVTLALAQSWQPWPRLRLSTQLDLVDRADSGLQRSGRLGAELELWDSRLALRAGSVLSSEGAPSLSTGIGLKLPWAGEAWSLDYAIAWPASPDALQTTTQRLSLSWGSGAVPKAVAASTAVRAPQASLAALDQDPSSGIIRQATLQLGPSEDALAQAWELALINDKGTVVRNFQGKGTLPASLEWDGKDNAGALVSSSSVSYSLRIKRSNGQELVRRSVLFGEQSLMEELGTLVAGNPLQGYRPRAALPADRALREKAAKLKHCRINADMSVCTCSFSCVQGDVAIDEEDLYDFWRFVDYAKKAGYKDWTLRGHADSSGAWEAHNQRLSERRADEALRRLLAAGMKPDSVEMIGAGTKEPVADEGTEEGRRLNRRVEIIVRRARLDEGGLAH